MNFTEAVNVFINMVVQTKGLPFKVKIPNAETKKAIKEARKGINVAEFSTEELSN